MSFDWADYLALAKALTSNPGIPGPEEAALRSAISRAYFAAHCAVRNFAHQKGELRPLGTAEDHRNVIRFFRESLNEDRQRIGTFLERLRIARNDADYKDQLEDPTDLAGTTLSRAERIFQILKRL